ncbi:MAG: RNA polymerase sigma factor [Janthinobacterium lividum]
MSQSAAQSEMLQVLLAGCRQADRAMQQRLYGLYYSYALSICLRYTRRRDEAEEVVNDGFLKAFRDISRFDTSRYELTSSFRGWLKKIMIRTAIDYFRAHEKYHGQDDLADLLHEPADPSHSALDTLAYDDLLRLVQQLPPAYRTAFNLFAIDGYTHDEIAQHLGITTGTSKSNLSKARAYLQHLLKKTSSHVYATYAG